MIVRITGEGQYELTDRDLDELNRLDDRLTEAVDSGSQKQFESALVGLLRHVRSVGLELPADHMGRSDLVLPGADATLEEIREVLGDEGLIPGNTVEAPEPPKQGTGSVADTVPDQNTKSSQTEPEPKLAPSLNRSPTAATSRTHCALFARLSN
jgi:hypothetical protein